MTGPFGDKKLQEDSCSVQRREGGKFQHERHLITVYPLGCSVSDVVYLRLVFAGSFHLRISNSLNLNTLAS